jgi:ethylmalonyl-CoA/methylmalonyl-CoA decarboxylase
MARRFSSLVSRHQSFLSSIRHHGEGSVHYKKDLISEIILDNPNKRNALSGVMINELIHILDDLLYNSPNTIGLIIRGKTTSYSTAFCAGLDFTLAKTIVNTSTKGLEMCALMTDALNQLRNGPIISLALIHGPALGGGAELSTACDYRAMTLAPTTEIGFVHGTIGASPGWGGASRLLNIVGRNKSIHLLCSAERLKPAKAQDIGLCDHVLTYTPEIQTETENDVLSQYGHEILNCYTRMPFPSAVKDLKSLIADLSNASPLTSGQSDPNHINQLVIERNMFQKRWGSEENSNALKKK